MPDDDNKPVTQPFLARWSQKKQEARAAPAAVAPAQEADTPPPDLPPVDGLTPESDFSGFMHPKVDPELRRAALKKLFSDPHFNVMDGLDTYIDDYSQPNPLPPAMLAGLRQAQNILAWAKETKEETAARFAPPTGAATTPDSDSMPSIAADTGQQDEVTSAMETTLAAPQPVVVSPADDPDADNRNS